MQKAWSYVAAAVVIIGAQGAAPDADALEPLYRNIRIEIADFTHVAEESQSYAERYEKLGLRYFGPTVGEEVEKEWRFFVSYNPSIVGTGNPEGDFNAHPLTFGVGVRIDPGFGEETYIGYTGQLAYENTEDVIEGDRFNYIGSFFWRTDLDDRFAFDAQIGGDIGSFDFFDGAIDGWTGGILLQLGGEYAVPLQDNRGVTAYAGFRYGWTAVNPDNGSAGDLSTYSLMVKGTYFQGGLFGGKSIGRLMLGYEYEAANQTIVDNMHYVNLGGYLDFAAPFNVEIGLDFGTALNDFDEHRLRLNFQYRF